jgi:YgiT-type zinc finger domain-containing protein
MKCFFCKGDVEELNTTYFVDIKGSIIAVRDVPSLVCTQCGEVSYNSDVAEELEKIVNQAKSSITEVSVVHYPIAKAA